MRFLISVRVLIKVARCLRRLLLSRIAHFLDVLFSVTDSLRLTGKGG